MSVPLKIEELYAWVSIDPADGDEGVLAVYEHGAGWIPAIGADKERIESYRGFAETAAKKVGMPIRLQQYSTMPVLETINTERNR